MSILPAGAPTFGSPLTDERSSSRKSSNWIRSPLLFLCFAIESGINWKFSIGITTGSASITGTWSEEAFSGRKNRTPPRLRWTAVRWVGFWTDSPSEGGKHILRLCPASPMNEEGNIFGSRRFWRRKWAAFVELRSHGQKDDTPYPYSWKSSTTMRASGTEKCWINGKTDFL